MSLRLLLDEDTQDKILVAKLRKAGHNILTVQDAGLSGQSDKVVLARAVEENRIVLTRNCTDFSNEALLVKNAGGHHHGISIRKERSDKGYEPR